MDKVIVVGLGVVALAMWLTGRWLGRRTLGEPRALSASGRARIDAEVRAGRTIAAVKLYGEASGCSLVAAKEAIDAWPAARTAGP